MATVYQQTTSFLEYIVHCITFVPGFQQEFSQLEQKLAYFVESDHGITPLFGQFAIIYH
jgi:hypothetical protein